MLRNLKIGKKLALGFGLVIALAVFLGGLAVVKMQSVATVATDLAEESAPMVQLSNEVERNSLLAMYANRAYSFTMDPEYLAEGREQLTLVNEALEGCRELAATHDLAALRDAVDGGKGAVNDYTALLDQTEQTTIAMDGYRATMDDAAARYLENCTTFLNGQNEKLSEEFTQDLPVEQYEERLRKITLINEVIDLGNGARVLNFKSQALRDPEEMQKGLAQFEKMETKFGALREITRQPEDIAAIDAVQDAANTYQLAMSNYLGAFRTLRQLGDQRNSAADKVLDIAKTTAVTGVEDTQNGSNTAVSELATAAFIVQVGLVVVLVLGISVAFVIARGIVKPVRATVDMIKDIAQGEGDLTKRLEANSRDEVGELAKWFNTFIEKLQGIIKDVAEASNEVASAATEISASSEELAAGMDEQSQQVAQISSAIEEMSQSVSEVAQKSNEAAGSANESGKVAKEGGVTVEQTIEGMNGINEAVSTSAASVEELGKRGEQIGEIVEVINDIADQTNLLALNAAIEAARAGEHGRGFAVVADEVRKLADRTTKATEEIAGSIEAIQTETKQAVERMSAGTEQVTIGVQRAGEAGESLTRIVASAGDVAGMIQSIASAAEEQAAAAEQVSHTVTSINSITQQSNEGTRQAAAASSQLSNRAEQLQRLVGQFKIA
jgi:methyl-accepting chemotaxis protein